MGGGIERGAGSLSTTEGSYFDEYIGTIDVGGTTYNRYKRIICMGKLGNAATKQVSCTLNQVGILNITGIVYQSSGLIISVPWSETDASNARYNISLYFDPANNKVCMIDGINRTGDTGYATIEYYK